MFELKKYRELCVIKLKIDGNFEEKIIFGSINDMRNLVNFTETLKNLKNCTLRNFFVQSV